MIQEIFGTNWEKSSFFAIGNKVDFLPQFDWTVGPDVDNIRILILKRGWELRRL